MNDVEKYLAARPLAIRTKLESIRQAVSSVAPDAHEGIKYGAPALYLKRVLVVYSEHTSHIGFYPTPKVIEAFAKELSPYKTSKGAVQFPLDKPLPVPLIKKMMEYRMKLYEVDGT